MQTAIKGDIGQLHPIAKTWLYSARGTAVKPSEAHKKKGQI